MFKTLATALALATVIAIPATDVSASSSVRLPTEVVQEIRTKLTEQGYEVRKIEKDDGLYEVYAIKDGQRLELYLNTDLEIVRQEIDD